MLSCFNLSFLFSQWWKFSFQTFIFCCCFWRDIYIHRFSSLSSLAYKILLCLLYKDFSLFSHFYIIVFIWALVLLIFIAFKLIFIKHFQFLELLIYFLHLLLHNIRLLNKNVVISEASSLPYLLCWNLFPFIFY